MYIPRLSWLGAHGGEDLQARGKVAAMRTKYSGGAARKCSSMAGSAAPASQLGTALKAVDIINEASDVWSWDKHTESWRGGQFCK